MFFLSAVPRSLIYKSFLLKPLIFSCLNVFSYARMYPRYTNPSHSLQTIYKTSLTHLLANLFSNNKSSNLCEREIFIFVINVMLNLHLQRSLVEREEFNSDFNLTCIFWAFWYFRTVTRLTTENKTYAYTTTYPRQSRDRSHNDFVFGN